MTVGARGVAPTPFRSDPPAVGEANASGPRLWPSSWPTSDTPRCQRRRQRPSRRWTWRIGCSSPALGRTPTGSNSPNVPRSWPEGCWPGWRDARSHAARAAASPRSRRLAEQARLLLAADTNLDLDNLARAVGVSA